MQLIDPVLQSPRVPDLGELLGRYELLLLGQNGPCFGRAVELSPLLDIWS